MKYILALLLGVGLFYSCRYFGGKRIKGNGNITTQQRNISSFSGVDSYGSFDIDVVTSETFSVVIEGDENLLQYVETNVEGGNLKIGSRNNVNLRPTENIRIKVSAPYYNSLSSSGSGNIRGTGILSSNEHVRLNLAGSGNINIRMNAPSVEAEIAGSGNISVSGTTKSFSSSILGSGNIRSADMQSEQGKVEIAGSGSVEIFASEKLDVNIMGSGGVKYKGDAQINTNIAGSGSVSKMN